MKNEQIKPEEIKQEEQVIEEVDYKDKYLRLLADVENIRKNSAKQVSNAIIMANEKLIKELLPFIDALDLAIDNSKLLSKPAEPNGDYNVPDNGLLILRKQLFDILSKFGFQGIKIKDGDKFNVDTMDAIMTIPTDNPENHELVAGIMNKGYTLNGNVIRHANVVVYNYQEN